MSSKEKVSLPQLINNYNKLIEYAEEHGGELPLDSWEENEIAIKSKVDGYYKAIELLKFKQDKAKERYQAYKAHEKALGKAIDRLKENAVSAIDIVGDGVCLRGNEFYFRKSKIDSYIYNEGMIPDVFFTTEVNRKLNKKKVQEAIKLEGEGSIKGVTKQEKYKINSYLNKD